MNATSGAANAQRALTAAQERNDELTPLFAACSHAKCTASEQVRGLTVGRPCSVLIVEDEPLIQEVFADVLAGEGCEVALAGDGPSMRQRCAAENFDVVVLDIALPGGESGIDLAREATAAGCSVILITGHHDHFETVARSGYRYLFKPFRVEALVQAIHELLRAANASCTMRRRG
jgi:DNA-binding response OmpR family regulator